MIKITISLGSKSVFGCAVLGKLPYMVQTNSPLPAARCGMGGICGPHVGSTERNVPLTQERLSQGTGMRMAM